MGGVFGVVSRSECIGDIYYGTDYLSHLGTRRGGLLTHGRDGFVRSIHNIENAYFRNKFEPDLHRFSGSRGIGVISDTDAQPITVGSHLGQFGIVTVGKINNLDTLAKDILTGKQHFSEMSGDGINPSELTARLICDEDSYEAGIRRAQELIQGSCSFLLLMEKGLYAVRDRLGRTPLIIGKKDGAYAVSSETCAFPNLGYEVERDLGPGEAVFITEEGTEQRIAPGEKMQVCAFLWVYYGYPASAYEGLSVEAIRYRCGRALAANDDVEIDFVSGIPDSGIGHAIGYAMERRIPYQRAFAKYTPTWPRSFMPQNQKVRDLVAKMKLIPIKNLIKGNRILFCEDSIVRGTQLKDNVQILFEYDAREVHMRPACPVLVYPCEFLNFSTSQSSLDLAGRKAIKTLEGVEDRDLEAYARSGSEKNLAMIEEIRKTLKLSSLKFQQMDDLVAAIGLPKDRLCTHCWDGSSYF